MALKSKKSNKKTVQNKTQKNTAPAIFKNDEFSSLFTLVAGILLGVFLYFPDGFLGSFVKDIALGCVGFPIFLLPVVFIVNGIHKAAQKNYELHKSKYPVIIAILGVLCVLVHAFSLEKQNPLSFTNMFYNYAQGVDGIGGGLIGGFIADIFRALIGQVATVIVAITAILALTMVLVKWSPVKILLRGILKTYVKTSDAKETIKTKAEKYKAEHKTEENDVIIDFTDEQLGIKPAKKVKVKAKKADTHKSQEETPESYDEVDIDNIIDNAVPEYNDIPPLTDEDAPEEFTEQKIVDAISRKNSFTTSSSEDTSIYA